jgi:hypothetical protein
LNLVVGMPAVYASAGRLERFIAFLREELRVDTRAVGRSAGATS